MSFFDKVIGGLFDAAMWVLTVDWHRIGEVLAGTLLFWSAVFSLLAAIIEMLPLLLEAIYWLLFGL